MMESTVWIILGVVLGFLVLALVTTLGLFCWKRSRKNLRFPLRAVTPLDDAEFESWRQPSQYTRRTEKYHAGPAQPSTAYTARTPSMLEKDVGYQAPRTPSPPLHLSTETPVSPIRKPERVRRKSSIVSSIMDRPPTPYSPASPADDFPPSPRRGAHTSPHHHYPSVSEASVFGDFHFGAEYDSPPRDPVRPSTQSDRPLYLSYARYGESV